MKLAYVRTLLEIVLHEFIAGGTSSSFSHRLEWTILQMRACGVSTTDEQNKRVLVEFAESTKKEIEQTP